MHEYGSDKICLIQRRQSCSESEQLSNNEHWTIDNDNPEFPNIDPFFKLIFPIFGLLWIKSFGTFQSILLGVSCYNRVRTPFLFVRTEPRVFICVPTTKLREIG